MHPLRPPTDLDAMIQSQIIARGITDPRVLSVLRDIPRELFFPPDARLDAFADAAAPIGHGQTISQPYIVALMTRALDPRADHRVLEIGTGCGYQTAILSRLAREVWSVERIKPLLDDAFERLMALGLRNVHLRHGDGALGWPEQASFDRILIAAAAPRLPRDLLMNQLADCGVAVLPVGDRGEQTLLRIERRGDELLSAALCGCRFVPLIGHGAWPD